VTKGTAGLPKGTTVTVADLFSTTRTLVLKKPKHVCTPVDREGDGIKNADGHLVCYQGKPAKGQPKHTPQTGLHVTNPQSELVASTVKEAEGLHPLDSIAVRALTRKSAARGCALPRSFCSA
jgi:hypothetical protein